MRYVFTMLMAGFVLITKAQNADYLAYIRQYATLAMQEQNRTGIPASITLAQGLLESGAGKGNLVMRSNNHFGIKCKNTWTGATALHDDDARNECFRAYPSAEDSYRDHSDFLKNNTRYAALFNYATEDYQAWAHGLKKAGYATNPRYPQMLIKVIEEYQLHSYTLAALRNQEPPMADVAVATPEL
ncbi:MAG TPA: glucosaminidase domain-containing protein, partial [Phnomibacter sp.]|nr:glucosaminidase domain-containing protein [Phnomibacter sp.]